MENAPFFADIIRDAPVGDAYWLQTSDDVRIRVGVWPKESAKGTVLLFPGRTEYVEKYAHTAADLAAVGYAMLAVDWRGQGIADRLLKDPLTGHVGDFADYQKDVQATVDLATRLKLPKPWFLLGHSMGGCIGLRALHQGLPVEAAVFTGPMWGIQLEPAKRILAQTVSSLARLLGLADLRSPGTSAGSYVLEAPFEDNTLTTDPSMYALMKDQLIAEPDLGLGGPSLNWLNAALSETKTLRAMPAPPMPCLTFVGSNERIVDPVDIKSVMAKWPNGELIVVPGGEHEILMESADLRAPSTQTILNFFDRHAAPVAQAN